MSGNIPPVDPPVVPPVTPPATPPVTPPAATPITIESQKALDEMLGGRATRATEAARKKVADTLGVPVEKLDERLAALKKLEQDSETDAQRREREAAEAAATEARTSVEGEYTGKLSKAQTQLIKSAVITAATAAGFRRPEDAWLLLQDNKDIKINDDFVVTGADDAVKKVATDRPDWVGEAQRFTGSPPGGGNRPRGTAPNLDEAKEQQRQRLRGGRRTRL